MFCLHFTFVKAQTTLINSGNVQPTPITNSIQVDSLRISDQNQDFYQQLQKNLKSATYLTEIKEEDFNQKFSEVNKNNDAIMNINNTYDINRKALIDAKNRLRDQQVELNNSTNELEKVKKENTVLKTKQDILDKENKELAFNVNALAALNNNKTNFNEIISSRKLDLNKALKILNNTKDSLVALKLLVEESRNQITNSMFRVSSVYSLYDTSFTRKNKEVIIDSLSLLATTFTRIDEDSKEINEDIKNSIKNIDLTIEICLSKDSVLNIYTKKVQSLITKKDSININLLKKVLIQSNDIEATLKAFSVNPQSKFSNKLQADFKSYSKRFITIKKNFDTNQKKYNSFYKNNLTRGSSSIEQSEFGALPNITSLIGEQRALNLNVSILGSYTKKDDQSFNVIEAKLFTSNVPNSLANPRSLFIPEVSTFGTQIKYVSGYNFVASKPNSTSTTQIATTFSGNFELNLLSKRLSTGITSVTTTNPSNNTLVSNDLNNFVIHARGGGEFVILREVFSIYANLNWISIIDNVQKFHQTFDGLTEIDKKSSWVFFDVGCRILLNPAGGDAKKYAGSGFNIIADFNLIIPKVWGRQLINSTNNTAKTDMFIPLIRLGIRKSLGVISKK